MSDRERLEVRIRECLVNGALLLFIICLIAGIRLAVMLPDEIHQLRIDTSAQMSALRTAIQLIGNRTDSRLQDLHTAVKSSLGRLDSNMTDTRATIQKVTETSQAAATKQLKEARTDIGEKIDETNHVLAAVADKADETAKPVEITVPPVAAPAVVVPLPPLAAPGDAQTQKQKKPKRSLWRKLLPPWN